MNKLFLRLLAVLAAVVAAVLLTACEYGRTEYVPAGSIRIYRTDIGYSELTWEYYVPVEEDSEKQIDEVLGRLKSTPESAVFNKIIPDGVDIERHFYGLEGQLVLDFSEGYSGMEPLREILCRAGVVKTLCELDGVDGVEFLIAGQELILNGDMMAGIMTGDDFIDNTGDSVSFRQNVVLTVFYAAEDGKTLSPVRLRVESNGTRSQEELAVEQLIGGPAFETGDFHITIPEDTVLNKIQIRDGICYVDLSEEFLSAPEGVTDEAIVYSLVNTLTELTSVNKVRITVDSETVKTYGTVPIDGFLERRPDLIDSERAGDAVE